MPNITDPNDYIEWDFDPNHPIPVAVDDGEEKKRGRKRTGRMGEPWIGYIYDLIILVTLIAVVATLLKLLLS